MTYIFSILLSGLLTLSPQFEWAGLIFVQIPLGGSASVQIGGAWEVSGSCAGAGAGPPGPCLVVPWVTVVPPVLSCWACFLLLFVYFTIDVYVFCCMVVVRTSGGVYFPVVLFFGALGVLLSDLRFTRSVVNSWVTLCFFWMLQSVEDTLDKLLHVWWTECAQSREYRDHLYHGKNHTFMHHFFTCSL